MNAALASAQAPPVAELGGPWLGLQSYEERHSPLFFGRDVARDELFCLVERGVLIVLHGVSGLGKTSLLNAGLIPRLREAAYLPILMRLRFGPDAPVPIAQVRNAIAREIAAHCTDTPIPSELETLWEFFHRTPFWDRRVRLLTPVLVFDQFEEVLTFGHKDPRTVALFEAVADLVENYIPRSVRRRAEASQDGLPFSYDKPKIKVIFSLREDYLAQLQELRPLMPSLMRNCYRLKPMSGGEAREAVLGPARTVGLSIADEVADRIVRIAAGEPPAGAGLVKPSVTLEELEVEPVLLSLFCDALNKQRIEQGLVEITQALVQGERGRILSDFYERCLAQEAPAVRRYIEDDLLTKEGHRDTRAIENLPDAVKYAVDRLINLRLLRREERLGQPYVELIHDVLTEPIAASRSARRATEAVEAERCRQEERRKRELADLKEHTRRVRTRFLAGVAFVCLAFAGLAVTQWVSAEEARKQELALRLAGDAQVILMADGKWQLALLLATESLLRRATTESMFAWSRALVRAPAGGTATKPDDVVDGVAFRHNGFVLGVAFSPDARHLATASVDGAWVWEVDGAREIAKLPHEQVVTGVAFSPDGRRLATASADGMARVWVWDAEIQLRRLRHGGAVTAVAFSPDGKYLATASEDEMARVWDSEIGGELRRFKHEGVVTAVAFSPDSKYLAVASADGTARVWDVDGNKEVAKLLHGGRVNGVAFSPDGTRLATASDDNFGRVWDWQGNAKPKLLEHDLAVLAVAFSRDGQWVATGSSDRTAKVWKSDERKSDWKEYSRLSSRGAEVLSLAFSADSRRLATSDAQPSTAAPYAAEYGVQIWPVHYDDAIQAGCERLRMEKEKLGREEWDALERKEWGQYLRKKEEFRHTCE